MITRGTPAALDQPALELHQRDARLNLSILAPASSTWSVIDTAQPRHEWDSPNRGTRMVAFEAIAPESGQITLAVLATPGSCADSVNREFELRPLESWKP